MPVLSLYYFCDVCPTFENMVVWFGFENWSLCETRDSRTEYGSVEMIHVKVKIVSVS